LNSISEALMADGRPLEDSEVEGLTRSAGRYCGAFRVENETPGRVM